MDKEEITVKQTRGTVGERHTLSRTNDEEIAFVNALKALDEDKEMQLMYENAMKDLARVMFDMTDEDFENNEVKSVENDTK